MGTSARPRTADEAARAEEFPAARNFRLVAREAGTKAHQIRLSLHNDPF